MLKPRISEKSKGRGGFLRGGGGESMTLCENLFRKKESSVALNWRLTLSHMIPSATAVLSSQKCIARRPTPKILDNFLLSS